MSQSTFVKNLNNFWTFFVLICLPQGLFYYVLVFNSMNSTWRLRRYKFVNLFVANESFFFYQEFAVIILYSKSSARANNRLLLSTLPFLWILYICSWIKLEITRKLYGDYYMEAVECLLGLFLYKLLCKYNWF